MKQRLYEILETHENQTFLSKLINYGLIVLILSTVLTIIVESFERTNYFYNEFFYGFEYVTVSVFIIEYIARIYVSDLKSGEGGSFKKRIRYMCSTMAIIDLIAILPVFIPLLIPVDLRVLRMLRLVRLIKLHRHTKAFTRIAKVVKSRREELFSSFVIMLFVLIISSVLMYYAEFEAQPKAFPNIGASFWWAICTLTTVGYGDIYPITLFGKIIASIITILGIGLIALPTAIISTGFLEEMREDKEKKDYKEKRCPHCGGKL